MSLNNGSSAVTRRRFLGAGLTGAAGIAAGCGSFKSGGAEGQDTSAKTYVNTVNGPLACEDMGFTLPHEHIIVDWNGGDGKSMERYDPGEVFTIMYPYLREIRLLGTQTFVDCTPPYLGRDVMVLRRLSIATGLNIITNTGFYERPKAPAFAMTASEEELADMFVKEIQGGIGDTGIYPGFIKIGVSNEGPMTDHDRRLVAAACRAHIETGLTINSHTFQGTSALEEIDIIEREKVDPSKFVYVHAGFDPDVNYNIQAAERGVWIEFDSIRADTRDKHVERILTMLDKGFEDQLLISQDRGWYTVGAEKGGGINAYSYLQNVFLPYLLEKGIDEKLIYKLTVTNPARALALKKVP